jgi:hypothetical protein
MKTKSFVIVLSIFLGACGSTEQDWQSQSNKEGSILATSKTVGGVNKIAPISTVTWEWCNVYGTTPQKPCLQKQVYHWGPVESIKLNQRTDEHKNVNVKPYLKSKGCLTHYEQPQKSDYYSLMVISQQIKGKVATVRIVENRLLDESKRQSALTQVQSSSFLMGVSCDPLNNSKL